MRLFLTRHGETVENTKNIIQGQLPGQLTEQGEEQAKRIAERLKDEHFDIIYASDLARVLDTVNEIAKCHEGTTLCLNVALRERDFGDMQGKTMQQVWKERNLRYNEPVGGETLEEFFERAKGFVDMLKSKHKDQTVLCVSHDGMNTALVAAITSGDVTGMRGIDPFENTSLSIIDITDEGYEVECLNDTSHLAKG